MKRAYRFVFAATALALAATGARAEDPPKKGADEPVNLGKIAELEALVLRVEKEGFKRVALDKVVPAPPRELEFVAMNNTVDNEKKFRTAWIAAYKACGEDLVDQSKKLAESESLAKPKELEGTTEKLLALFLKKIAKAKGAAAAEIGRMAELYAPRLLEVERLAKAPGEAEVFAQRDKDTKKFLKRYDFGPKVAKAESAGTAIINVQLAPDTYELVKRNVYSWKFTPLKDANGADVKIGGKRIEYTEQLQQGMVREALQMLTQEYFAVRYAKWEKEKEEDIIRVTGAKLLFGTYYFIEHEDRIVVAREPAAK